MGKHACTWCMDTGWMERVRVCPCRAPERATVAEAKRRYLNAIHDPGCQDGWVYIQTPCDCDGAAEKRGRSR